MEKAFFSLRLDTVVSGKCHLQCWGKCQLAPFVSLPPGHPGWGRRPRLRPWRPRRCRRRQTRRSGGDPGGGEGGGGAGAAVGGGGGSRICGRGGGGITRSSIAKYILLSLAVCLFKYIILFDIRWTKCVFDMCSVFPNQCSFFLDFFWLSRIDFFLFLGLLCGWAGLGPVVSLGKSKFRAFDLRHHDQLTRRGSFLPGSPNRQTSLTK